MISELEEKINSLELVNCLLEGKLLSLKERYFELDQLYSESLDKISELESRLKIHEPEYFI